MSKSYWFGDEDQKGNFSNDKKDTFNPKKRYIGIRLQQGVPLLDRDWNELEDIRRYEEQMLRKWYIGDGIPDDDGFKIMPLDEPGNDFKIHRGRCLVGGFEVVNDPEGAEYVLYSAQEDGDADSEEISDLTNFKAYLDVWIEEVDEDDDPALANDDDVDMETCIRHQLKWRVRVRSGSGTFAHEDRHHYYDLAKIERDEKTDPIEEGHITDLRRNGMTLQHLRDGLTTNQRADSLHLHSKLVARYGSPDPALSVDNSGNVGIGTTTPAGKLQIIDAPQGAAGNTLVLGPTNVSNLRLGYHEDYSWIQSHGSKPLAINPIGNNVGIGTADPKAKLDVRGDIALGQTDGGGPKLLLTSAPHTHYIRANNWWTEFVSHPNEGWKFLSRDADEKELEMVRITSSGYVGMGTTAPSRILHVEDEIHSSGSRAGFSFADMGVTKFVEVPTNGERWVWHSADRVARLWSGGDKLTIDKDGNLTTAGAIRGTIEGNIRIKDTRDVNTLPSGFSRVVSFDLKKKSTVGLETDELSGMMTLAPDSTDVADHQLNFNGDGIFWRKSISTKISVLAGGRRDRPVATPVSGGITEIVGMGEPAHGITIPTVPDFGMLPLSTWGSWQKIKTEEVSDERFKAEITPLNNVLDKLEKVRGISFEWNDLYKSLGYPSNGGRREIGLIAQEVEAAFPELVTSHGDEKYRILNYERLTAVLVEAVKELRADVQALKRKINS